MKDHFQRDITYLRVSITDLCNLRCRYCMPPEGVHKLTRPQILTFEEIVEIVTAAAQLGVRKVRVTGGEPLIRAGVVDLCRSIAEIPGVNEVDVTTNGVLLEKLAQPLAQAGVRRVNISLDTLDPEKYAYITGGGDLAQTLRGIHAAEQAGLTPIKLNAVLIGGFNDDEIMNFVELTRRQPIELRFIELMPMGPGASFERRAFISDETVLEKAPELEPMESDGGVARLYRLPGGKGRVGLISPRSRHFCGSCNRIRLTSEGALKPCLHSNQEIQLRGLHGEELLNTIRQAILAKPEQHGELSADCASQAGRTMNTIGG